MDDAADISELIDRAVNDLRLVGIPDDAIARHLISRGVFMALMQGHSANEILDDIEAAIADLARSM